jgi:hypothetical protein
MVKLLSIKLLQMKVRRVSRTLQFLGVLSLFGAASASLAYGQFTLIATTAMQPSAVSAGETSTALISLAGTSASVSLSCTVTGQLPLPTCIISPNTAIPNATLSLTVSTTAQTLAGQYQITVSGTDGVNTPQTTNPLFLNVVNISEFFTLTVSTPINPGTVSPGGGATATITVTPLGSYSGNVTLSCLSITPTVVAAPICSFQAADGSPTVAVNGSAVTATLTINTYGTQQNQARLLPPRLFYALWLAVPGLGLIGAGAGKYRRNVLGLLLLTVLAGGVMVLPSCSGTHTIQNNNSGLVTPKNTYTLTLTGVDQNGNSPSNSNGTTNGATVSLIVN